MCRNESGDLELAFISKLLVQVAVYARIPGIRITKPGPRMNLPNSANRAHVW